MVVTHWIPSFYKLLHKSIHDFSHRISMNSNSIIKACLAPTVLYIHPSDNGGDQYYFSNYF